MINTKHQIEDCLLEISHWMNKNKLKLNQDKTELLLIHSKFRKEPTFAPLNCGTEIITPSKSAKNIVVTFDSNISLSTHIGLICKPAFFHLRNIARIQKYLFFKTTATLIHAFITSKVDYRNSILYGLPNCELRRLQRVLNAAARLLTGTRNYDHLGTVLVNLHWLLIGKRVMFKVILLTFKALLDAAPNYIMNSLQVCKPSTNLRSSNPSLLTSRSNQLKTYGYCSFTLTVPRLWNVLPQDTRKERKKKRLLFTN